MAPTEEETLEDQELAEVVRRGKNEPTRPFAEIVKEMRAAGEIDV